MSNRPEKTERHDVRVTITNHGHTPDGKPLREYVYDTVGYPDYVTDLVESTLNRAGTWLVSLEVHKAYGQGSRDFSFKLLGIEQL